MKKITTTTFLILINILVIAPECIADKSSKTVIKFATIAPRGSYSLFEDVRSDVRKQTKNEVDFKFYYGGIQGDETTMVNKIRYKQLHGAFLTGHGLSKIASEVQLMQLPFLIQNFEEGQFLSVQLENEINKVFEEKGYIVLGWHEVGLVYIFSTKPVTSVETAQNLKWWIWDDDKMHKAFYDAMDISPVSLSLTDILTSLSTRLVDVVPAVPHGALIFRWYTKFKYMSEYPLAHTNMAFVITKDIWKRVSPENQIIIKQIVKKHLEVRNSDQQRINAESIEILKNRGINVMKIDRSGKLFKRFSDSAKIARESLVGKLYSQELLDKTSMILENYRK